MMTPLMPYYRRRILIGVVAGSLGGFLVGEWLTGVVAGVFFIGVSLWAPHSGYYVVDPSRGAAALLEDERSRVIRARAAEVGFQAMLAAGCVLWFAIRTAGRDAVPHPWLVYLILLGIGTQIVSDYYFRRRSQPVM
jgi:hypothetical protein